MISLNKTQKTSVLRTANIFGVGVNAVSLAAPAALFTAFSKTEKPYLCKTGSTNKLPTFLFGLVLFLAVVTRMTAALFKGALQLINAVLEIAPRGILFFLSLLNLVFSHWTLSSAEWLMKANDEEDNSLLFTNDLPLFPLYVQHDFNLYE
ncbi:MAG: hypothetical protein H7177_00960 [Rhizobacter sp.]|nr:hypothetical protein [Bacteriovorax sp.]